MTLPTTALQLFALLLDSTIDASIMVLIALAATLALRKHSAALRHLVWSAALLSIMLMPLFLVLVPRWHATFIHSIPAYFSPPPQQAASTTLSSGLIVQAKNIPSAKWTRVNVGLLLWLFGCLSGVVVLTVESVRLERIARHAETFRHPRWMLEASELSRIFNLRRPVRFLQNRTEYLLVTWGALRPRVLLPTDADTWSEQRVRAVLGHELAHVRRLDWFVQFVAEVVCAIHWFNPLVWLACNRLRQEGERACDDVVLSLGVDGTEYAAHVLDIARSLKASSRRWSPALAMARHSNLERRFAAMLNTSLDRRAATRKVVFLATLAALCIVLPLSALRSSAQVQAGRFFGTVTDVNGAPVPNATVIIANEQAGLHQMTGTLKDGSFEFQGLPTGIFDVTVLSSPGERLLNRITMLPNQSVPLDFRLAGAGRGTAELPAPPPQRGLVPRMSSDGDAPPPPPPPSGSVSRIRQGGNVQQRMLVEQAHPVYPADAKAARTQGVVILESVIGKDGLVQSVRILTGDVAPELGKAAIEAVSQWKYKPTLLNGEPVEVVTTVTVNFSLAQ